MSYLKSVNFNNCSQRKCKCCGRDAGSGFIYDCNNPCPEGFSFDLSRCACNPPVAYWLSFQAEWGVATNRYTGKSCGRTRTVRFGQIRCYGGHVIYEYSNIQGEGCVYSDCGDWLQTAWARVRTENSLGETVEVTANWQAYTYAACLIKITPLVSLDLNEWETIGDSLT